jgi:hypothetical protein
VKRSETLGWVADFLSRPVGERRYKPNHFLMATDSVLDFFMPDGSKQITRIDLQPEEIIRAVKMRFRICNYLFNTGGIWIGIGGILNLLSAFSNDRSYSEIAFVIMAIGIAIFTAAFALTLAIYRCPVCDTYLSRFRPDKLRCPSCNAQVRESK